MNKSRTARRILAAGLAARIALVGAVVAAQPAGLDLPKLSQDVLSSGVGDGTPAPVTTTPVPTETTAPVPDANLQDIVPDTNFRRYLNEEHFNRPDALETPISAAEMATIKNLVREGSTGSYFVTFRPLEGKYYEDCDQVRCTTAALRPNLEGIQYAISLEVLSFRNVSGIPELPTMPHLRYSCLYSAQMTDFSMFEAAKLPALCTLFVDMDEDLVGAYPGNLNTFTQLESPTLWSRKLGNMTPEITEQDQLKYLDYGSDEQSEVPECNGNMVSLEELRLGGSETLEAFRAKLITVSDSMATVDKLKEINLLGNRDTVSLPPVLVELDSLETVILHNLAVPYDDPTWKELKHPAAKVW